jgi:hypothetical protein
MIRCTCVVACADADADADALVVIRNAANTRSRENGAYYDRMFAVALAADVSTVFVTSYNEWGEGTQIEPAVPHTVTACLLLLG